MADTIESYISDFTGPEIDEALNRANRLYEIFFGENLEKNVLQILISRGDTPEWMIVPSVEEVAV